MKKLLITTLIILLLAFPAISQVNAVPEPTLYVITQSTTTNLVEPITGTQSAEAFYNYIGASTHNIYTDPLTSKIYLYEETDTSKVSLIIHHGEYDSDILQNRVDFNFVDVPEGALVIWSDDMSHPWNETRTGGREFDLTQEPEGNWEFYDNTDGGVLELPSGPWTFKIIPDFIEGIDYWQYQETESITPLKMLEPLIISSDLSNVSPDPDVGLSFEDPSGGSIDVTRLFGCTTSNLPTAFFDIRVTFDDFGTAQICVKYDDSQLNKGQEKNLRLWATDHIIEGDVNFDGIVDHKDIQSIKQAIKRWKDNPIDTNVVNNGHGNGWNPYTDINCDGYVDDFDLGLAKGNLDEAPSPWFDITTGIDTDLNMLYGDTEHFSIFRGR